MLEAIGLSAEESRLYAELVKNPRSGPAELGRACGVSAANSARILARFVRIGLAGRLPGRPARYVAVAPDVSLHPLLGRREEQLHRTRTAIAELMVAHQRASRHADAAELVEVISGAKNIVSRALALQAGARRMLRGIDKAPYVMSGSVAANADSEHQRIREGIEYRVIYDTGVIQLPGKLADIRASVARGEKARVLANPPLKLWMVDDVAALIPFHNHGHTIDAAFIAYPSALLDAIIALFELEWERATPIRAFLDPASRSRGRAGEEDTAAAERDPDPTTRALLALLAAGLTDEAAARALGLSLRTLQRRISELMRDLGASTRFQAGMAARERGWV